MNTMKQEMQGPTSGITGECTWAISGKPGKYTLVISGNGPMADYDYALWGDHPRQNPWEYYKEEIKTLIIQDGVTAIGTYAFLGCARLRQVTLPGSVTAIGTCAFSYCFELRSVHIPGSVTAIGNEAFKNCRELTSVVIPGSVTSIGERAFAGCRKLTSVIIPDPVTTVNPGSVIEISKSAFASCRRLTSVTNHGAIPQNIDSWAFAYDPGAITLRVPSSALDAYKSAEGWKDFGTIVAI